MGNGYREKLFKNYNSTHVAYLDPDNRVMAAWFCDYVRVNYLPLIQDLDPSRIEILEIGCNKGFALSALHTFGFEKLQGVDMSPVDIQTAKKLLPQAKFQCVDAFRFLQKSQRKFDVIILKAVLEHVPKGQTLPLLQRIEKGLKAGGRVIVDVPNMDWLLAQHERYMDFTHEVGFTRESLGQMMRNVFPDVSLRKGRSEFPKSFKEHLLALSRPWVLGLLRLFLKILGEGASEFWWDCRSIIAVGKK